MASKDNGITALNPPKGTDVSLVIIFLTLALYNVTELAFIIPTTFKRRSGNYFWFFVLATWSIVPYSIGFMMKGLAAVPQAIYFWVACCFTGWCGMVLFQSLVLWSRLHLIVNSPRRLRAVLYMIIFNAIICDVPVAVLAFGSNSPNPEPFAPIYSIWESMHVTIFAIQELIISGIYVWETSKLLRIERDSGATFNLPARSRVIKHLFYVSIIVVLLDIPTMVMQYTEMYALQTAYKGFVYSVKLKLEFSILNKLIEISRSRPASVPTSLPVYSGNRPGLNVTTSSAPPTLKSRDEPTVRGLWAQNPSALRNMRQSNSLRWLSHQYGRNAELDTTRTGLSIVHPCDGEGGTSDSLGAIQVAVETSITIEPRDGDQITPVAKGETVQEIDEEKLVDSATPKTAADKEGVRVGERSQFGSGRFPLKLPPHPSESLDLPEILGDALQTCVVPESAAAQVPEQVVAPAPCRSVSPVRGSAGPAG